MKLTLGKIIKIASVVFVAGLIIYAFFVILKKVSERGTPPSENGDGEVSDTDGEDGTEDGTTSVDMESFSEFDKSYFGFMQANKTYAFAEELGVHWERNPFAPFIWGEIEKSKGSYDWQETDNYIKKAQNYDIALVATIWPYADWDQDNCRQKLEYSSNPNRPDLGEYKQMPCEMDDYKSFVRVLVERYDGDGEGDMDGLKYPVKYWEVMDEPEEGEEVDILNFRGENQAEDYLEILKITAQAVKESDSKAKVLNGGIFGLEQKEWNFWETVFRGVGRDYVDVLTIHAVNASDDLQMELLSLFMEENTLTNPVWITEIQVGTESSSLSNAAKGLKTGVVSLANTPEVLSGSTQKEKTEEEWAEYLVKVYAQSFADGAQRLFYAGLSNRTQDQKTDTLLFCDASKQDLADNFVELDTDNCTKQKPFHAFSTLVDMIDYFEDVEELDEGQYKFTLRRKEIYVLWGSEALPKDVKGSIRVTDLYGESSYIQAENLYLTSQPVYVEVL